MIAAGHVRGRGWLQTTGLPTPHRYVHIQGDLNTARIPDGVPAVAKESRGDLGGSIGYE